MTTERIGLIGVGQLGRPLLDRLRAEGRHVTCYVRRPEQRSDLAAAGVPLAESISALGAQCSFVILFVYDDEQLLKVALADGLVESMQPGSLITTHSTVSPRTVESIAEQAGAREIALVDAPLSGGAAEIANGRLTLLLGGESADVERCRAVFAHYAEHIFHVGPLGGGEKVKLINNVMLAAHIELALEACRVGKQLGIEPQQLATYLGFCSGDSYAMQLIARRSSPEQLLESAGHFLRKDALVAREAASDIGAELGVIDKVLEPFLARVKPKATVEGTSSGVLESSASPAAGRSS